MTRTHDTTVAAFPSTIRGVRAAAGLSVLALLWQFVSAGQILVGEDALGWHGAGAIALHVTTALLLAATVLHGRRTRVWWPAAVAGLVFVLGFVQAALGSAGSVATHVPVALVLTVGIVWLAAWSVRTP
jgi:predicted anti-sigma-YlaC factor YlaD